MRVLIDSDASSSYARRASVERNRAVYEDALNASKRSGRIAIRLATGKVIESPKIHVDLQVRFEDFDCVERFTVLDLDEKYDLILGMPWLEEHEPWIDWRSKSIGASKPHSTDRMLVSKVPTSANWQRRRWRERRVDNDEYMVGVSELIDIPEVDVSTERQDDAALSEWHGAERSGHMSTANVEAWNATRHEGAAPSEGRGAGRSGPRSTAPKGISDSKRHNGTAPPMRRGVGQRGRGPAISAEAEENAMRREGAAPIDGERVSERLAPRPAAYKWVHWAPMPERATGRSKNRPTGPEVGTSSEGRMPYREVGTAPQVNRFETGSQGCDRFELGHTEADRFEPRPQDRDRTVKQSVDLNSRADCSECQKGAKNSERLEEAGA